MPTQQTPNLGLEKYVFDGGGRSVRGITREMNDNWDILDSKIATDTELANHEATRDAHHTPPFEVIHRADFEDGTKQGWTLNLIDGDSETGVSTHSRVIGSYGLQIGSDDRADSPSWDSTVYEAIEVICYHDNWSMDAADEHGHLLWYDSAAATWRLLSEVQNWSGYVRVRVPEAWFGTNDRIQLDHISGGSGTGAIHTDGNGGGDHSIIDEVTILGYPRTYPRTSTEHVYDANLTTTQTSMEAGGYVNVAESVNVSEGFLTRSNSEFQVQHPGKYRVDFLVNFHRTGSNARNIMFAELELNGTRLSDRTRGVCYIRNDGNGDEGDATGTAVLDLSAGDDLRVYAGEERGAETGNDIERASIVAERVA